MSELIELVVNLCAFIADHFHFILVAAVIAVSLVAVAGLVAGMKAHKQEFREKEAEKEKESARVLERQQREQQRKPIQAQDGPDRMQREHAARLRREMRDESQRHEEHLQQQRQAEAAAHRSDAEEQLACDPRLQELWSY